MPPGSARSRVKAFGEASAISDLVRLIYSSRPFGFDQAVLNGVLMSARRNNSRDQITGALVCRGDLYLQWLEGPAAAVSAAFDRIAGDDRHLEVRRRLAAPASERLFAAWAMRDDPPRSWMWSAEAVAAGALEHATESDFLNVFSRLSDELH